MTEGEMVGWHHQLSGHDFEQTWEIVKIRESWHASFHGVTKSWTQLSTDGGAKQFRHHGSLSHSFLAFSFIKKWAS